MEIQFWGAAQTVTGSMHLLKANGQKVLLDCGLFQGRRKEAFERNRNFPFDPAEIDALIISHAHTDHIGNIPTLVRQGFNGPIYATPATRDLCEFMLKDSAHIQLNDVEYVNKKRIREGKVPFEPLYTADDVLRTLSLFEEVNYQRSFTPVKGVQAFYRDAGHVLGSASITLDVDDRGRTKRLVFSGDIGRKNMPILRDPQPVDGADFMIMESTYGGRTHEPIEQSRQLVRELVNQAIAQRGKIIVPSFALGRTQEVIYALNQLTHTGEIPKISIYVDSPLAVNLTEVFKQHPDNYDQETKDFLADIVAPHPFGFEGVTYVRDVADSKALNDLDRPAIIISASGMCESGRVLHHLKHTIDNPRNTVVFVGYQAENTLGRKILDGQPAVSIYGEELPVRARVVKIGGMSAHADHPGLLTWLKQTQERNHLQKLFLVHGEIEGATALAQAARQQQVPQVFIPEPGQAFEL
jgi:metallo-beta-lactamase family protein